MLKYLCFTEKEKEERENQSVFFIK